MQFQPNHTQTKKRKQYSETYYQTNEYDVDVLIWLGKKSNKY